MSQRRLPEPRLRDEFRRELRARLMREAAVTLVPKRRDTAWTAWLRPALAVSLAALVLIAGASSAAASSVPGDVTFGLKRAIEEVRVALTFDDVERVRLLAQLADQRLSELEDELNRCARRADFQPEGEFKLLVCFGIARDERFESFGRMLFDWFRCPALEVSPQTVFLLLDLRERKRQHNQTDDHNNGEHKTDGNAHTVSLSLMSSSQPGRAKSSSYQQLHFPRRAVSDHSVRRISIVR